MSKTSEPPDPFGDLPADRRAALLQALLDRSVRRAAAASITRRPPDLPAPLSFAQRRLWFLDRLGPATPTYHMARAIRMRGRLRVETLERSLNEIVRRHDILRTTFAETASGPIQVVAPSLVLTLPVVDLGALPEAGRDGEVARRAAEEVSRPFDLERGQLLRGLLLRLAGDEHVLVLTLHHIVGDGWSMGILDRELAALYAAYANGRPSPLPDPTLQYADFAHWQRRQLETGEMRGQIDFWRRRLEGARRVLDLPLDRARPAAPTFNARKVSLLVPGRLVAPLKNLARREGATPFMGFLAPFLALLHRWSGHDDLCVGTPVAGRTRLEIESIIGPFVNTLVLRGDLSGDPTWIELLRRVRTTMAEALGHQEAPFEKLVEELGPERDPSAHPLFQAMFVMQDVRNVVPDLPDLRSELVDFEIDSTPFDLTLILSEADDGMEARLEYAADLFDRTTIERMAGHFGTLLEALARDPSQRVSAIALPGLDGPRRERHGARKVPGPAPVPDLVPLTATMRALARIWTGLLGRDSVGPNDNFFHAGGHSLLVLQLVSRVREELRLDVPVRLVFERPTLGALAEWIDGEARRGTVFDRGRIERASGDGPQPVSFAQKRLWFIDQLQPGSPAYNIPLALRLRGRLDAGALERSLEAIVGRHEALRTVFPRVDGGPAQAIRPAGPFALPRLDRTGMAADGRDADARTLAEREARAAFDLERGPLFRGRLLRFDDEDHVLMLTMHHIVSDGWSLGVLLRELGDLYEGFVTGRPVPLPDLPIQYADYAAWERGRMQGEILDAQVAYWRRRLAGAPVALDLPAERPRPKVGTFRGSWRPFRLPGRLTGEILALTRSEGTTLFVTLLAAFQALLGRYSGQDDLCVGTPVAGRNRLEVEGLIGCFVNTLVLRGDLSGNPTFREFVRRSHEAVLEAQAHQELPFDRLVELLSLPRDLARQPLFQVAMVMQNMRIPALRLPGLSVETLDIDTGTAKFDLTLQVEETEDGLAGSVEYSADLFDAATIDRMIGHFCTLLAGAAAAPDRRLSELPLLTTDERRKILGLGGSRGETGRAPDAARRRSAAAVELSGSACLHEMFEAQVRSRPGAPAVTFENDSLSYEALDARADRVARLLRARGVGPETMVGVCLDRSPDLLVAILGTLKAGGAYVPLDPAYPRERLAFILEDAQARVVLTRARLREALPARAAGQGREAIDVEWIDVEAAGAEPGPATRRDIDVGAHPDRPAYVIYTSGSTGRPKGVVVTHRNVARLFAATRPWFEFGPEDVWSLFHSSAFDFSVWEMWGALLHGGRLVIVPFQVSRSPATFLDLLRRERVTVLNQTPSAFRMLMHAEKESKAEGQDLALRLVLFGGEALEPPVLRPWFERHGDERPLLVNMYGITETTVHVTYRPLRVSDLEGAASPIGRPIPDLRLYLLDGNMEPVPHGVAGEMFVGGAGVSRGYRGRPDLTAERFVPDPHTDRPGARLYRTGDRARRRVDGEIEFLGRCDDQVKIRGFRIEPGEIEATLSLCPGVRQAAVIARQESAGERRLVAYVVPDPAGPPSLDALRLFLMERLPDYMVPAVFILLDSLPVTPGGKLDRRALPAPERARPELEATYRAPRTPDETTLASVWSDVLGLERVGIDDNFFALGGDSIRSLQVRVKAAERGLEVSLQQIFTHQTIRDLAAALPRALPGEARRRRPRPFDLVSSEDRACLPAGLERVGIDDNFFALGGDSIRSLQVRVKAAERGLEVSLQQIFTHQTIRDLAAALPRALPGEARRRRPRPFDLVSSEDRARLPAGLEDAYPLSRLQEGLVFHSEYSPDYIIYVSSVEVRAPFLRDRLEAAVRRLVERHPILRTSFDLKSFSEPLQLVHRTAEIPIGVEDLTGLPPSAQDETLAGWVEREMRRRFDWGRPPLARLHVHLLGEERFQLALGEPFFDGWSVATFLTELLLTYAALGRGEIPPPARPLESSYRDFVALEVEALRSPAVRDFWAGKVEDATATRLPRREGTPGDAGALPVCRVGVEVAPETSAALQRQAWSAGVPLKSVLLAAHLKVVSLLAGRRDVTTGLIANGRPEQADGEAILGIFLNTLPFRMRVKGGSWADLARLAFETEREMLPYRRFPMAELQRMTGGQFLSDTAFNYTNFHVYRRLDRHGGVDLWGGYGFEQTYFALTAQFNLDEVSASVAVALDYRSADLTRGQVEEIAAVYHRVLAAMAADPLARHDTFSLLTPDERRRALVEWNDTRRDAPLDRCVHELFEAQAGGTPGAVAVVDGATRLTYRELNHRANRVAHRLVRLGVGPETPVAVCHRRSHDLVAALLGVLKAGGAYVPLDPAYPKERLAFMLDDARAPVLVTERRLLAAFPPHPARVLCLDDDGEGLDREPADNPRSGVLPENLAYVIYTSGSTGRPKGAAIEHCSTVSLLHWAREEFGEDDLSGVLASSSVCFDSSVLEIFAPLSWGGTIILAENALHLPTLAARDEVRLVNTVPSAIAELVRAGGVPASVRTVSLAGEALQTPLVQAIYTQETIERVVNLYGLSEATVYTTIARLERKAGGPAPIGRPVSNTRVYVLDENREPLPAGVPGEIFVGGVGPGRGYLNRPDLTAERFVPDPFGAELGARLYRTGDLGRFRADGTVDFLGRIDQQVKIRGFRIEPGEVESALNAHPGVAEAVVQVREEADGDRRLVAYVVRKTGPSSPSMRELRRHLAGRLPEPMLPSAFVELEALPRTPNGKLDRKALPAPSPSRLSADESFAAPVTPDEKKLARLWGRVLKIERVGIHDNFFEAGGHSLLATQLVSRLREWFQVELPLRALFETPTIAGLVQAIERARSTTGGTAVSSLRRAPRDGPLPLSFAQQRLWFLDQLEPGCAFYNIPAALRLKGELDADLLRRSLNEIVGRHEALRTTFEAAAGEPVQVISEERELALPLVDLRHLPAGERESAALRLARQDARAPFDLRRGPLVRTALLRLGGDDHVLLLTTHHIVSDGWSMNVLLRELAHCYEAFRDHRRPALAGPEFQYVDFAAWQRQWLQGDVLRGQLEYWKKQLAGAPTTLDLPSDRPRPPVQTYRGAHRTLAFPKELAEALGDLGRREGVTLFMTLLAAFQALLFRYTGQETMLIGSPIAGRNLVETEALIGLFVNTLVLRGDLSGDPSFGELLARTRDAALGSYAHQDLPFEKLVEALQPERHLGRAPLFQVMFALQPPSGDVPALPGVEMRYLEIDSGTSQFDLTLSISEDDEGLGGSFEYSTELFDEARIGRMGEHLEVLLRGAAADRGRRVSTLPLLPPSERRRVLVDWSGGNATPAPVDDGAASAGLPPARGRTVLDLFDAQVARGRAAPAVVSESDRLTYDDLDRRATGLALRLRALGVGREVPVAICLERSPDFVVGLLGVMKAGGAYVPLDPSYPRERLDFVLQDTRAPVLLAERGLV
ncbi:MAG: amino acid adenylation domain-containing protein, partial [Candidatus Eisenbacteria bacterium]